MNIEDISWSLKVKEEDQQELREMTTTDKISKIKRTENIRLKEVQQ